MVALARTRNDEVKEAYNDLTPRHLIIVSRLVGLLGKVFNGNIDRSASGT